jgi:hypothetical protein
VRRYQRNFGKLTTDHGQKTVCLQGLFDIGARAPSSCAPGVPQLIVVKNTVCEPHIQWKIILRQYPPQPLLRAIAPR